MITKQVPTWGHRRELWDSAKTEAQTVLEKIAKEQGVISYSELARKIASINFQPDGHDFHGLLGQLSEESDADSKGMISALVVHKDPPQDPGRGFFNLAKDLGRDISDPVAFWSDELKRVYRSFA
jgi:hypothetical protein